MKIVLILHNIRSTHNVGSLLRSGDGFGVERVYFTGYTPYPKKADDERLPHMSAKIDKQIRKTALGAEKSVSWEQSENIVDVIARLKAQNYEIAALEQTAISQNLTAYKPASKIALVVGNEIEGIDKDTLDLAEIHLEIPMRGKKESFNVAIAGSIAMFYLSNLDKEGA